MFISAVRCTLSYLVFPFLLPVIGATSGVGTGLGMVIAVVAIAANALSIRRFWAADHRYKIAVGLANAAMIGALTVLVAGDINDLVVGV